MNRYRYVAVLLCLLITGLVPDFGERCQTPDNPTVSAVVADVDPPIPPAVDADGDPLPPGAVVRFGSARRHLIGGFEDIAFVPGDSYIASTGGERLHLWERTTGRRVRTVQDVVPIRFVVRPAFSPDGNRMLSAVTWAVPSTGGRKVRTILSLRALPSGRLLAVSRVLPFRVTFLAVAPNGKRAAVVAAEPLPTDWSLTKRDEQRDERLLIWDFKDAFRTVLSGTSGEKIMHPTFSGDSRLLTTVVGATRYRIKRWDLTNNHLLSTLDLGPMENCAVASGGELVAGTCLPDSVSLIQVPSGKKRLLSIPPSDWLRHHGWLELQFAEDGRHLLVIHKGSRYGLLSVWDVVKERFVVSRMEKALPFGRHVRCVCQQSKAGLEIVSLHRYHRSSWFLQKGAEREVAVFGGDYLPTEQEAEFGEDGRTLIVVTPSQTITWDTATGLLVKYRQAGGLSARRKEHVSPDGRWLAVSDKKGLRVTDRQRRKDAGPFEVNRRPSAPSFVWPRERVGPVAFSADSRLLGWIDQRGALCLYELASGQILHLFAPSSAVFAFTPRGWRLAVPTSEDNTLLLWDLGLLFRSQPVPPGCRTTTAALWPLLASHDAPTAHRALWRLAARQGIAAFVGKQLPAVQALPRGPLATLIRDLKSDEFRTYTRAEQTLERARESARPSLEAALNSEKDLEVHLRLKRLLSHLGPRSPRSLRDHRAVLLLEARGTAEAKRVLRTWAKGLPQARLTREAKEALARLERQR